MAARHSLLIVDPDALSLRVLEVSLRKAGFEVWTATTAEAGWRTALEHRPEVVLTDTHLPDDSGFDLAQRIREDASTAETGIIFLSSESSPDAKMRAIEAGADEFLAKPVLVKEIVHRVKALLERSESESLSGHGPDGHLRGTLSNMGVVDILQVMEAGAKSGVVHLISDRDRSGGYVVRGEARAALYFRDGQLVDGQLGALAGAEALYRVLLWEDGDFEIEFVAINRPNLVDASVQMVLLEGMRRVDEWSRLVGRLPSPNCKLTVDYRELGRRFGELPSEVRSVIHLIDGERSAFEVVDAAPVDDDTAVSILSRLLDAQVIDVPVLAPGEDDNSSSIEKWLSGDIPESNALPSALGQAVIPSPHSPSEILAAAELPEPEPEPEPDIEPEAAPEPAPVPRSRANSLVLSRRTVPANPTGPASATALPAAPAPIRDGDGGASAPPRLSIQKVSSVVQAAAPIPEPVPEAEASTQETRVPAAISRAYAAASSRPLSTIGRGAGREEMVGLAPPAAIPPGAVPSDEPNLVIAPNGSNGHAPVAAAAAVAPSAPIQGAVPKAPLPAPSNGHGGAPPGGAAAEANFFSGEHKAVSGEDLDWDRAEEETPFLQRLLPVVMVLAVVAMVAASLLFTAERKPADEAESKVAEVIPPPAAAIPPPVKMAPAEPPAPSLSPAPEPMDTAPKPAAEAAPAPKAPPAPAPKADPAPEPRVRAKRAPATEPLPRREAPPARSGAFDSALRDAESALATEDLGAAKSRFSEALSIDRRSAQAHSGLAYTYLVMEELPKATRSALTSLKLDEKNARANFVLGTVAQSRERIDKACFRYRRYLSLGGGPQTSVVRSIVDQVCGG